MGSSILALVSRNLTALGNPFTAEKIENDEKLKYAVARLDPFMIMPLYFISAGIVAARNGDAMAYNQILTTYDFSKGDDKRLADIFKRHLMKLPTGKPAEKK